MAALTEIIQAAAALFAVALSIWTFLSLSTKRRAETGLQVVSEARTWESAYMELSQRFLSMEDRIRVLEDQNRLMRAALMSNGIMPEQLPNWRHE